MRPKWIKVTIDPRFHYCKNGIDINHHFYVLCCESSFGTQSIDEIVNDLTHHDKCKDCMKIWEQERNDRQRNK